MYNQMNFVFNHSDKLEALGTQYYELLFKTGVIANRMTENHAQGLKAGEKGAGGYLVPDSMEAQIVQTLAEENVMRCLATVIHMEDGERTVPVVRSTSEAQWLDENEAMEMGTAGFEAARLKPRKLGLTIPVSNELLADAGVDMAAFLADSFARRIASGEEKAFLTGDGVKQPAGLLNSAQVGVTTAVPDALTADEIISLYYALDEQYRAKAVFLMHEDTAKALQTLKDENGCYLWREALGGESDRLLGRPVYTSRFMPKLAAGAKPVVFGDLSKYWIADRGNRALRRYGEVFALRDQTAFVMTERVDGKLIVPEAVKVIRMAAE